MFSSSIFDRSRENDGKEADEQLDEDELIDAFNEEVKDALSPCDKRAAEFLITSALTCGVQMVHFRLILAVSVHICNT